MPKFYKVDGDQVKNITLPNYPDSAWNWIEGAPERSDDELYANALRTSVGFGVRWFSPIGPLRFEWGFPLQRLPDERSMVFDFSIQQSF